MSPFKVYQWQQSCSGSAKQLLLTPAIAAANVINANNADHCFGHWKHCELPRDRLRPGLQDPHDSLEWLKAHSVSDSEPLVWLNANLTFGAEVQ